MNAYSSGDLLNWKFEGVMISQRTIMGKLRQLKTNSAFAVVRSNHSATVIVERPKVVFCPKTRRYVMYFHLDHRQERRPHYRECLSKAKQEARNPRLAALVSMLDVVACSLG